MGGSEIIFQTMKGGVEFFYMLGKQIFSFSARGLVKFISDGGCGGRADRDVMLVVPNLFN